MNFMTSKYGEQGFSEFILVIQETFRKQNLRGFRYIFKDTNEWANGLPKSDLDELNELLQRKFGENLLKQSQRNLSKINRIVKKGKINNEDEYRLLLSRVDEIFADESKKEEVEMLNKLLADFHK